jgi:hypothetical protein
VFAARDFDATSKLEFSKLFIRTDRRSLRKDGVAVMTVKVIVAASVVAYSSRLSATAQTTAGKF